MNKNQLEIFIDSLIPKFYSFAYALSADQVQAEQLVIDAYTVYTLREKDYLMQLEFDSDNKKSRVALKRLLTVEIYNEIYELARKKYRKIKPSTQNLYEYKNFHQLTIQKKAILYLKEKQNLSIEELQEIFALKRHQVIELYHNAKHSLVSDMTNSEALR
ncbi:MAG: hypothetical protein CME62_10910 [Halobacteriovoraceae bacterium]|nr:hypothetical protein [Halobacteriovoraceae bacterium]|tara:strand:+ start:8336 stop:8815 length:480 start_codon:yes stop_codon:yes gene_type:complete